MNLIISGRTDTALLESVAMLTAPTGIATPHAEMRRFEGVRDTAATRSQVADLCDSSRVDHAFVDHAAGFASFGLLVMDMDSTFITIECIDELADMVGRREEVAAITEATMRGEIADFGESLRRRVALLVGADAGILQRVFEERLAVSAGANELVRAARAGDAYTLLVSGGFTYFSERLVSSAGFDAGYANSLEVIDGKLTGRLLGTLIDAKAKAAIVKETMQRLDCRAADAIVIGDGSNDIPMMKLVEHSVAYHAKPAVLAEARHSVRYGTLRAVIDFFA